MAFNLMAAIGGAAKRGSEFLQEERKSAYDLIDQNMTDWTRLGVPAIKDRKKLRMGMKNTAEFLSSKGFSNDQIAVALYQNKHEQVAQHVTNLEAASKDNKDLQYKPADIITFGPDYQESGKTMDEILDGVMGKVASGMSTSDALADMGGSGLQRAFMTQRAEAAAAASGLDVATLRAIATDDLEYGEAPEGGVISIVDPVASAQAASALEGGEAGMFGSSAATSELTNFGNLITGAKGQATSSGTLYVHEQADRAIQVSEKVASLLAAKQQEVGRNRLSATEIAAVKEDLKLWATESGIYAGATEQGGGGDTNYEFTGDADTIGADFLQAIKGADDTQIDAAWAAASAAALKYFQENEANASAAMKAFQEWQERTMKSMQNKPASTASDSISPVDAGKALRGATTLADYERRLATYMEVTGRDDVDNIKRSFPPPAS
jgi:hypothetical protein